MYWILIFTQQLDSNSHAKRKLDFGQVEPNDPEAKEQRIELVLFEKYLHNHAFPKN